MRCYGAGNRRGGFAAKGFLPASIDLVAYVSAGVYASVAKRRGGERELDFVNRVEWTDGVAW